MITELSNEQLNKLPAKRLLNIYKRERRALYSCFLEDAFIDSSRKIEYEQLDKYCKRIKSILNTKEHIVKKPHSRYR